MIVCTEEHFIQVLVLSQLGAKCVQCSCSNPSYLEIHFLGGEEKNGNGNIPHRIFVSNKYLCILRAQESKFVRLDDPRVEVLCDKCHEALPRGRQLDERENFCNFECCCEKVNPA
ncbi:MAG: hypothetical protein IT292_04295 [Deltaproteobacteria bacterium]|nr:hypothetical protein [Deltaproteobacteria bacterium]